MVVTSTPERSLLQRREALERANDVRSKRADLKKDLNAGKVDFVDLVIEPPDYIETMKLIDLMLALRKYGRVKVNKILNKHNISSSKTIGGLSPRQRAEIVREFRSRQ